MLFLKTKICPAFFFLGKASVPCCSLRIFKMIKHIFQLFQQVKNTTKYKWLYILPESSPALYSSTQILLEHISFNTLPEAPIGISFSCLSKKNNCFSKSFWKRNPFTIQRCSTNKIYKITEFLIPINNYVFYIYNTSKKKFYQSFFVFDKPYMFKSILVSLTSCLKKHIIYPYW